MNTYTIEGAWRGSGTDVTLDIEAMNGMEAERLALQRGIMVSRVVAKSKLGTLDLTQPGKAISYRSATVPVTPANPNHPAHASHTPQAVKMSNQDAFQAGFWAGIGAWFGILVINAILALIVFLFYLLHRLASA